MAQPTSASEPPTTPSTSSPSTSTSSASTSSSWARPLKQFSLFALGASFTAASVAIARRSVLRRQAASYPRFYAPNPPPTPVPERLRLPPAQHAPHAQHSGEGALLGVQALGLATLNVCSFGVLLTGGLAWAFDLSSVGELRERTQRALRGGGHVVDEEDEEEFERMVNDVLARLGMDKMQGRTVGAAGETAAAADATTTTTESTKG
ncbi:hypothetical protein ESCO_003225 [Escovopsis weberi]|uniref:Altered inheritance of mitochondria protein 11 n=1 Tax=Escovopsis weberi TaxID=150374 RepID=A0A0M8MTK7_ESCWE|nr:hypothetical protein ESCO_003225 [Escovopsis weberi]